MTFKFNALSIDVNFKSGNITSLVLKGNERIHALTPLFTIRLRNKNGESLIINTYDAKSCVETDNGAIYTDFTNAALSVRVTLTNENGEAAWRIAVSPLNNEFFVEWVDFPTITLPELNNKAKLLWPYNEGVLISDTRIKDNMWLHHNEPEYPSMGSYSIFPNMLSSQMIAYLWNDIGLYIGAHDERRGVKEIDFLTQNGGVTLRMRLFCGVDLGEKFETEYPIVFSAISERWEAAAERYRQWFEESLPTGVKKTSFNDKLPEWYGDSPLVITYPIRGVHDTDEMKPNKLYPYTNAIPVLDEIKKACNTRLLVLLMHWEGTAPWAPPYVWPPFGDQEDFNRFLQALHKDRDMLGVYCSGFGYTLQSNLISDYNKIAEYTENELWRGMCAGPDGKIAISKICTDQRVGYDICPASAVGKELLKKAYTPLFESELDYVQILDQNHGGGQYFCYSREHGHAAAPGAWMTENMQDMLGEWNGIAGKTLFGCESAASEPFIANLTFSDNRFELNYSFGEPVPLYSYIYHEYVRNFMGNQVCCPFTSENDTLRYRLAYSFSVGDSMTLVLTQDGDIASYWGMRDFSVLPDKEKTLTLVSNLTRFYKEQAKPYLFAGRMIPAPKVECESVVFATYDKDRTLTLPAVLSSAWEAEDRGRALILVNPSENEAKCKINKKSVTVPPLDAIILPL
ncbi:MAG: hypothetical protein E7642_04890 [Ruminococcaceae bacterium]|nr:hypothetical protein [Oscillospiraceae bacterium]